MRTNPHFIFGHVAVAVFPVRLRPEAALTMVSNNNTQITKPHEQLCHRAAAEWIHTQYSHWGSQRETKSLKAANKTMPPPPPHLFYIPSAWAKKKDEARIRCWSGLRLLS
jgi:hypothetical protein